MPSDQSNFFNEDDETFFARKNLPWEHDLPQSFSEWETKKTSTELMPWSEGKKSSFNDLKIAVRLQYALESLTESVEVDPHKRGGIPLIEGSRFTIAQLLAEIADGQNVNEVSDDFDLDEKKIISILHGLSICLDRPFRR